MKANLVKEIQTEIDAGYEIFDIDDAVFLILGNSLADVQYLLTDGKIIGMVINGVFQPYDAKTPWKKLSEEKRRSIKDYRYKDFEPFGMDAELVMMAAADDSTVSNILQYLIEEKGCEIIHRAYKAKEPEGNGFVQPFYELWDAEENFLGNLKKIRKEGA